MRVHLGQWHVLTEHVPWPDYRFSHQASDILRAVSSLYTRGDLGASFGLTSPEVDEEAWVAADIKGALRHALWAAQPQEIRKETGYSLDSVPPMRHSQLALPVVTVTREKRTPAEDEAANARVDALVKRHEPKPGKKAKL
jgi:hypothetical protein